MALADKEVLQGWLWRVPFLASVILIVVAVFIRLRLKETPVFQELEKHKAVVKNPVGQIWKHSKKNVLIGIGLRMGENGNSSIYSALLVSFISMPAGIFAGDKFIGPTGLLIAAGFAAVMVVTFGALSDRFGRVPVYRYGALFQAVIALPAFYLVTLGNVTLVWVVMVVGIALGVQSMLGPQCALLPELFGSQHRFTGVALSRELSAVLAGGFAPMIGVALLAATGHSWLVPAIYSLVLALISFGTTFFTPETNGRDLLELNDAGEESVHAETDEVRVVVATPLAPELCDRIAAVDPRVERVVVDQELLPPMRHPADFSGDPSSPGRRSSRPATTRWSTPPRCSTASRGTSSRRTGPDGAPPIPACAG